MPRPKIIATSESQERRLARNRGRIRLRLQSETQEQRSRRLMMARERARRYRQARAVAVIDNAHDDLIQLPRSQDQNIISHPQPLIPQGSRIVQFPRSDDDLESIRDIDQTRNRRMRNYHYLHIASNRGPDFEI